MNRPVAIEEVQKLLTHHPYHRWLGLQVLAVDDDAIELKAAWREDWAVDLERRFTHGGVLAALVDIAADWSMVRRVHGPVLTIDLRVDYHAAALPGDLVARGRLIKWGARFASAEAHVFNLDGKLLASGRGTFLTGPAPRRGDRQQA